MSGYKVVPVHDTVEGYYTHVYPQDMDSHHEDIVQEWLADNPQPTPNAPTPTFQLGDHVRKTKGSQWKGRVVGTYSTTLTPEGYAVESDMEKGSVQIYPVGALELAGDVAELDVAALVDALGRALDFIRGDGDFEHREALERCECYACVTDGIIDSLAAHRKGGES